MAKSEFCTFFFPFKLKTIEPKDRWEMLNYSQQNRWTEGMDNMLIVKTLAL